MKALIPVVLAAGFVAFIAFGINDASAVPDVDPAHGASVLFFADTSGHEDAYGAIADSTSVLDWGVSILALPEGASSESFSPLAAVSDDLRLLSESTGFEEFSVEGLTLVIVDRHFSDADRCGFSETEIDRLISVMEASSDPTVVISDFAFWRGIDPPPESDDLVLNSESLVNCPGDESIIDLFSRLPVGAQSLFVSRANTGVHDRDLGSTRFVQIGTPPRSESAALSFLRIGISHGELTVSEMKQSNPNLQDGTALDELPTYNIQLDDDELRAFYNAAPFYDRRADWPDLLEDRGFQLATMSGSVEYEGASYAATLRTRGSFGNHWGDVKKSWTLDVQSESGINGVNQLKFVLPYDRLYLNQLFVQDINRSPSIDVMSPEVTVGRLTINGRDFGPYIMYEDFNKPFVELSGFNSDAQRAGLFYRDLFGLYDIWDDPNFIEVRPDRQDKSQFLPALSVPLGYDEFAPFFEPANYQSWIASQLFTGDHHQNAQNNTRFFVDLATGRYIMVSWDQFFARIESVDNINNLHGTSVLQFEILEHESDEVFALVQGLIDEADVFEADLSSLRESYLSIFQNDPYLFHKEARIAAFADSLGDNFRNNVDVLSAYVAQR